MDDVAGSMFGREQAKALRQQARVGGLRFEAYLSGDLADWLLEKIERGVFADPSEAVFVILAEHEKLAPHRDLRDELLRRSLQAASNDSRPGIPYERVVVEMDRWLAEPRPEPACWEKIER